MTGAPDDPRIVVALDMGEGACGSIIVCRYCAAEAAAEYTIEAQRQLDACAAAIQFRDAWQRDRARYLAQWAREREGGPCSRAKS